MAMGDVSDNGLLPLVKTNDLMEFFPKILNVEKDSFQMTPSQFIKEMSLTTEERHKMLVHNSYVKPPVEIDCPSHLRVTPNILVFQKWEARSRNMVTLQVRNIGKTLLPLRMHCPTSLYFSASVSGTPIHKLAPGLSIEYNVRFTPKEVKDYNHQLIFKCKEDIFNVPIIALGSRAILDIPDRIILNPAPVKLNIDKCIVIRNIGDVPATFNFITQRPFKINPSKGFLTAGETMIVTVSFECSNVGEKTEKLYLVLETGEKLTIQLHGSAENVSVRLERNSLVHEDTFLGLKRVKSLRLINNSSNVLKYSWKRNETLQQDLKIIESLKPKYEVMADTILYKGTHLDYLGLCNFENHKHSCRRILRDELQSLEKEEFEFRDEAFAITPEKGEVWPKGVVEFIVSFEPKHCTTATAEAYLEVTGRETRLPLQLRGQGLGPKITINPQTLDTDYIYLCSHHKYEVVAINKGDIPGKIEYKIQASIFGGKIDVEPRRRELNPGECGVFIVSFTSNKQGEFIEQLSFVIQESGEMVSFILTGKIVSPTLHFDRKGIDFGTIPFGFPTVQDVTLNNLSVVPVTFSLRVTSDGDLPSMSYKRFASVSVKPPLPADPREFHIDPEESVVEPFSSKKVTLTLTANKTGRYMTNLEMDMWDSESSSVSCPIRYYSLIPTIVAEPDTITIPFCFINFPYTRSINLRNISKVSGFFYIVPSDPNESTAMTCSASIPQGVIEPSSSIKVDITLLTSALGRQVMPINLLVFGRETYREVCTISCVGQGPVVTVSPSNLHWGETMLLEESQKTLVIFNESPVPSTVSVSLAKPNTPWFTSVADLILGPSEKVTMDVHLFLRDRGLYKDTLRFNIHNGKVLNVHLSATGVGSSLDIRPKIYPAFDLGTLFSNKNYAIEVSIENKGSKPYGLVFSPFQDYTYFVSMKLTNPSNLIFKFEPTKMDLMPGEYKTMTLIVQSGHTGYFHQMFYCFASIGVPSKELHFTTDVFADFVEPLITFNKNELRYWYNIGYDGTDRKLEDEVEISNMSVLSLRIQFSVHHPFRIQTGSNDNLHVTEMLLKGNSREKLTVRFVPEIKPETISRTYSGHLNVTSREHSKKFVLALNGEVNYPTLLIAPKNINFDFVPIATNVYREIVLVNVSPLTVYFNITWNATTASLTVERKEKVEPVELTEPNEPNSCLQEVRPDTTECLQSQVSFRNTGTARHDPSIEIDLEDRVLKMPKIEISKMEIRKALFPLSKNYYDCEEELMNAYRAARSSDLECTECVPDYAKVCDITPLFGKLEKYTSQILSVRFCSETPASLHLEAMINIKSGPTEIVSIDAVASEIKFVVDNTELDFDKQLFCKPSSQNLIIRNTGDMPFHYEIVLNSTLENGLLNVSPSTGSVAPYSNTELIVSYTPRIPGGFEQKFRLHVAFLEPTIITVKGYGVFPQAYLALPRTDMLRIPPEIGYIATAGITCNWLLNEFSVSTPYEIHYIKPYRSQESNLDSLSVYEETEPFLQDWEFIQQMESMPTDVDIQLAVERILAINLLSKNSDIQGTLAAYARSIPDFVVPAYETDFGTVVIGECVERTLTVTNYGPLPVVFYTRFGSHLKEDGVQVRLKNRNELAVGVNLSFLVTFSPKKTRFKKQLEVIEDLFHLEVYHGPRIPVKVLATVTYPYLISSSTVLNYGDVVCGCCKVTNLKLKNPGLVPASWSLVFVEDSTNADNNNSKDGRSVFHLNYKSGLLHPEESCSIQISFKPESQGCFSAILWARVANSWEEMKVLLLGEGVEPRLRLSEDVLRFGPTSPYPNKLEKYFTVENPCTIPIEFYFPTFDEQIFEEDKILRAVCTYYQSREILLPVRKPGEGLPVELINFYQILLEDLSFKLAEQEREKAENVDENPSTFFSSEDDPIATSSQISFSEKKKKKMKRSLTRTRTSVESTRGYNAPDSESKKETSRYSILQKKTPLEVEELLHCHIKQILNSNPEYDPIQAALKATIPPPKEEEYKQGLLVIFHGAPYTNSIQMSNRAALLTGFCPLSIDRIVLEEATYGRCEAGLAVKELIEEAYWDHIETKPENDFPNYLQPNELNDPGPDFGTAYEELEKKLNALLSMREYLISNKAKQLAKSSSALSESSRKEKPMTPVLKPMNVNVPVANITEDLVNEILRFRIPMEISKGMMLESLRTSFIASPIKALTMVLKAAGNVQDILAIFLLNNYTEYNRQMIAAQMEQDDAKARLREKMLNLLEEEEEEKILQSLKFEAGEDEEEEFVQIRNFFIQKRHASRESFENQKIQFYETLRRKKTPINVTAEQSPVKSPSDKKKEGFEGKSSKPGKPVFSEMSAGRAGSEDKTGKGKKDPIELEFAAFEAELTEMRALTENWDQRIGAAVMNVAQDATKNKKGQTPRKPQEANSLLSTGKAVNTARGIQVWLADVSRSEKEPFTRVCCHLKSVLEKRYTTKESDYWPLDATESMTFSVVSYPSLRPKPSISDVFALTHYEPLLVEEVGETDEITDLPATGNIKLDRSISQISFKGKRKGCPTAQRRKDESRTSIQNGKGSRRFESKTITGNFKSRWIIQPGESLTWRVRYFPIQRGETKQEYPINIVNCLNNVSICCIGLCDIPALDMTPEIFYPTVAVAAPIFTPLFPAYFYSDGAFNFGTIPYVQQPESSRRSKKKSNFRLLNKSSLPLSLAIASSLDSVGDDLSGSSPPLIFEPDRVFLEPGESTMLSVTVSPNRYGQEMEALLLIVKDNPKVEVVKVKFEGVKVNVSVEPKSVNFDRMLLHRKDHREIVFTNNNSMPLYVRLCELENVPVQFNFSSTNSWIPPTGISKMNVSYDATEIQQILEHPVLVQVFDDPNEKDPVQELSISLTAETYDVALDIVFSEKDIDFIDFGSIRILMDCDCVFNLINVGKYPLSFKIVLDENFLEDFNSVIFNVVPLEGLLQPGRLFPVVATINAGTELMWNRVQVLKIHLMEPKNNDELVAKIPLDVSVESHSPRYLIMPFPEINFGHIRVASDETVLLKVENKGRFPLSYLFESHSESVEKVEETTKKASKATAASSKEKDDKGKKVTSPSLIVGPFEISPTSGIIEVDESATITVVCRPTSVESHEKTIWLTTNESPSSLEEKHEIILRADACLPSIDFGNFKTLFKEHYVVKSEAEFTCPKKFESYTLFTEKDFLFSFKNICLCKSVEARIHLPNIGLVNCRIRAQILNKMEHGSRFDVNKTPSCFTVSPGELVIEPYNTGTVILTFRPEAIEEYRGCLVLNLEMPEKYEDKICKFDLFGNGVLPQIEITDPQTKSPEGPTLVNFVPTAPMRYSTCNICFTNVGPLACKVIMELYNNRDGVFTLVPKDGTERMLQVWETAKPIDHTVIVATVPGEKVQFTAVFNPKEVKTYSSQIKLFPVDNPFENLSYKLIGDGYFEEVTIEKIRTFLPFLTDDFKECDQCSVYTTPGQFALNFNDCHVKKETKALLRLLNKTEKYFFKFEWEEASNFTVFPSVGHLYPNTYKEILVKFLPEEPMELDEVPLACTLNKIAFDCPPVTPAWDSRQNQMKKLDKPAQTLRPETSARIESGTHSNLDRIYSENEEPRHEIIPETSRMLFVNVSATADYARLYCDPSNIIFKNTFMFQTRIHPFVLQNTGNVMLEYKLYMSPVVANPLKEGKMTQVRERSFVKECKQQVSERPQSWVNSSSSGSSIPGSRNERRSRPKSLSSASLLDMNPNDYNPVLIEDAGLFPMEEESKMVSYNPFLLENSSGQIPPREKSTCNIIFSPMDINEYKAILTIQVPNLHPDCRLPQIQLTASSLMPYCHFNVPESNYLESGRRDYSRPGPIGWAPGLPLSPDTKTIEIKVLGLGHTIPIKFHVINPTEKDYTFSWVNVTQVQPDVVQSFHCSTMDGRIQAGRQQKMLFNFVSQKLGVVESFWKFYIPEYNVETLFLLVGDVREPSVYFLSNHLNLRPTFVGASTCETLTLVNNEDESFEFKFISESLYSEGRLNALNVEPMTGKILANSEINIRITFTGRQGGKILFFLKCKIKGIQEPFVIAVEATTYVVQPLIMFEDLMRVKHSVDPDGENLIDFGSELTPNRPQTVTFFLSSISKTAFYYDWIYDKRVLESKSCKIKFSVKNGHVASLERGKCDLSIVFTKKSRLTNYPLKLKVRRGPVFTFLIKASSTVPSVEFSSSIFDFGYCFLQERDVCYYEMPLIIQNKDVLNLVLEGSLPESSAFTYSMPEAIVPSGGRVEVLLRFHPRDKIPYSDTLKFVINGLHEKFVTLKGHGTDFKVTLENPKNSTLSMGAVKVGKTCIRQFCLINNSLAPANLVVGFSDQLPVSEAHLTKPEKSEGELLKDHRLSGILTLQPSKMFTIQSRQTFTITVSYSPRVVCPNFTETVCLQFQDRVMPLCMITACCIGPDLSLDRTFVNFGAVVEDCSSTMKIKILNRGNIGARFQWACATLAKEFSIYPSSGYCSQESDVTIELTFHPVAVSNCVRSTVECLLFLSENETYPSLSVTLMGSCVSLPQPKGTIFFECFVRETDAKTVEIDNWKVLPIIIGSGSEWQLFPVFTGEYFKGGDVTVIPPLTTAKYEICYCPLLMTPEKTFHEGSLFFRLPNGQGLLFNLRGVSLPPRPEEIIEREIPCKTKYVELLKIRNWLQYIQRLRVEINCVTESGQDEPVWTCTGLRNLDLPPLTEKEYNLSFFAYKPGNLRFHVSFINEETNEYTWFDIIFKIVMCGPLEIITMKCGVRQTCRREIKLENPLQKPVQYKLSVANPEIRFEKNVYTVAPGDMVYVQLSFTPIHVREQIERCIAECPELGIFPRELRLVAVGLPPEPPTTFETPLGSSRVQTLTVQNLSHLDATFKCRTDSEDFLVRETEHARPGQEIQIRVTHEPTEMSTAIGTLYVESEEAGNFTFPLMGTCVKPLARGPYILKPGSGINITFKNVFKKARDFYMYVDNSAFILKTSQENILPKAEINIYVGLQKEKHLEKLTDTLDGKIDPRFPFMGQLMVECYNPYVKWQFYLKGVLD